MPELLARQVVDEVIFDVDSSKLPGLEEVFLQCDEEGVRTRVAIDFFPHVNSEITLDRVGNAPLLTFSAAPLDDLRLLMKRFFDIVYLGGRFGPARAAFPSYFASDPVHLPRPGHFPADAAAA